MEMFRSGIFQHTEDAVRAAKGAFERFSGFSLRERVDLIRELCLCLLQQADVFAELEAEETGMGVFGDKRLEILKAIQGTPGTSYIRQSASSDEEGLVLEECFPYGVACVTHPVNHPSASIINSTIMMLAAGNSVIHVSPARACKTGQAVVQYISQCILDICGIDNLVVCMAESRYEYNLQLMQHPDVSLVVVTGGEGIVSKALELRKRVIIAGSSNPVTIVDDSADLQKTTQDIVESVTFDNNLLCTSEKCAVVHSKVKEEFFRQLSYEKAYRLDFEQAYRLQKAIFDTEMQVDRAFIGQSASTILAKAGILTGVPQDIRLLTFEAKLSSPFVVNEVAAPILPVVEAKDFDEALELACYIEQGCNHTASIHSKNIDHLSEASRRCRTAIFVKNGSTLYGAGIRGNGHVTFTIANVSGEGVVSPRCFVRSRKCILVGSFERT